MWVDVSGLIPVIWGDQWQMIFCAIAESVAGVNGTNHLTEYAVGVIIKVKQPYTPYELPLCSHFNAPRYPVDPSLLLCRSFPVNHHDWFLAVFYAALKNTSIAHGYNIRILHMAIWKLIWKIPSSRHLEHVRSTDKTTDTLNRIGLGNLKLLVVGVRGLFHLLEKRGPGCPI